MVREHQGLDETAAFRTVAVDEEAFADVVTFIAQTNRKDPQVSHPSKKVNT